VVGTAVLVAGISMINSREKELVLPLGKGQGGGFAKEVNNIDDEELRSMLTFDAEILNKQRKL